MSSEEPERIADAKSESPEKTESKEISQDALEQSQSNSEDRASSTDSILSDAARKAKEREERFKTLKARAKSSVTHNLREVFAERRRQTLDPRESSRLARKAAEAEFKLAKADTEEEGLDFERKRAWDWTVEESEKWDRKQEKKKRHVEDVAFQDYTQAARKIYKKQIRELKPDLESYVKEKSKVIRDGQVVEIEHEDGTTELVAVDQDGEFYSNADSLGFIDNKPSKANVDKLVNDLRKAEETRYKNRKRAEDDDITYINDKNKQFNQKLARYYNKYTAEIRDSFERGTMI